MPELFQHQRDGAHFLASRQYALLADEQRVGKTAAAITAADSILAQRILVVTTASGRANWAREFKTWGAPRPVQVMYRGGDKLKAPVGVVVIGWKSLEMKWSTLIAQVAAFEWDLLIVDESHYAKTPSARRTKAVYNLLFRKAAAVWCLSGTPIPNAPNDLWPMLDKLAPERLAGARSYEDFVGRYCVVTPKYVAGRRIEVVKCGKNHEDLNKRLAGFWLRRTQQDVGITKPIFSVLSLHVPALPAELVDNPDADMILAAAETGETASLEQHLGVIRRITGSLKAHAAAEAAAEMLEDGLDKLVLMAWHTDVIDILRHKLARYGVVGIDGRTPGPERDAQVQQFRDGPARVFVGQIQAAGEAIDLSAAAELWFVEESFTPKDMAQAAMRITNHTQKRQPLVRVCALDGSIDDALMASLTRKVKSIHQIMEN